MGIIRPPRLRLVLLSYDVNATSVDLPANLGTAVPNSVTMFNSVHISVTNSTLTLILTLNLTLTL